MTDIRHHNTAEPQRDLEPSDAPAGATRRSVMATLGGATLGVAALGLAATRATADTGHRAVAGRDPHPVTGRTRPHRVVTAERSVVRACRACLP